MTTRIARLANGSASTRVTLGTASRAASLYGVIWVVGAAALTAAHALTGGHYQNVEIQSDKPSVIVPAPPVGAPPSSVRLAPAALRDPYPEFRDEQMAPATIWAIAPAALGTVATTLVNAPATSVTRLEKEPRTSSQAATKSRAASSTKSVAEKHSRPQPAATMVRSSAMLDSTDEVHAPKHRRRGLASQPRADE